MSSPTQRLVILDEQNQHGVVSKLLHVTALNVIVFFRTGFGYEFLSPIGLFFAGWLGSVLFSMCFALWTHSPAAIGLKFIGLALYVLQIMLAYLHFWTSRTPRHKDDSGVSFFQYILPLSEYAIHVIVEPLAAAVIGCVLLPFDLGLGIFFLISAVALFVKDLRNYHLFRVKLGNIVAPLITLPQWLKSGGVKIPGRGPSYTPPIPRSKQPVGNGILNFLKAPQSGSSLTKRPRMRRAPNSPGPQAPPHPAPAQTNYAPPAPRLSAEVEADYARILGVPPSGVKDLQQLRTLWKQSIKVNHPDKVRDPAKKAAAKVATQKLNEAYVYFRERLHPVGIQRPL